MFSGKEKLMPGGQGEMPDEIPVLMREFIAQFRGVTEKLELFAGLGDSLPSVPGLPSLPGLPAWPAPGALSASQVESIAASVSAQRRSIETLATQLAAFDEQLAALEQIPASERLHPEQVVADIKAAGALAFYEPDAAAIVAKLDPLLQPGDVVVVFSNGGFGGIHQKLLDLGKKA